MGTQYIYVICKPCGGDGVHPGSTLDEEGHPVPGDDKTCTACYGLGKYLWGYIQDEIEGEE